MLSQNFSFIDVETSGGSITRDRIIDIGIIRVENNKIVEKFESLINPETYVPPFIEELTGIRAADLESAPSFRSLKDRILELLTDSVFVAHNARFDYGFLRNEFRREKYSFNARNLCTVRLSQLLFPTYRKHNLDSILERFSISCKRRHRAFDDALAIYEFFGKAQRMIAQDKFSATLSDLLKKPSIPKKLQEKYIDKLPESAGVYIFFDKGEIPLYVGKSINIRDRVMSHFSNDYTSSKQLEMTQSIERIDTIPTAGELGALISESFTIKTMQPLYNRMLRFAHKLTAIKKDMQDGYDSIKIDTIDSIDVSDLPSILAITRSKKQAKELLSGLVKKHNLCEKLLGLHKTRGACFASHLGWCFGACTKKESSLKYNIRFLQAFSKTKISQWPFNGPIAIREEDPFTETKELLIVDNWCLVSRIYYSEGEEKSVEKQDTQFDYDTYKILKKFVLNPINQKNIVSVGMNGNLYAEG